MPSFNGWNIIAMPSSPAPRSIEWSMQDVVAVNTNPFTGGQQVQDWQAAWLEASITLPPLTNDQAVQWIAFLMQCQGMANVFQFGDPLNTATAGAAGSPVVHGGGQTGRQLVTSSWYAPTSHPVPPVYPGDWIQIGYRLYRNLTQQTPDRFNSGQATLDIWPPLRESPADGTAIVIANTQGLFRLAGNQRKVSVDQTLVYGLQFNIREAL